MLLHLHPVAETIDDGDSWYTKNGAVVGVAAGNRLERMPPASCEQFEHLRWEINYDIHAREALCDRCVVFFPCSASQSCCPRD